MAELLLFFHLTTVVCLVVSFNSLIFFRYLLPRILSSFCQCTNCYHTGWTTSKGKDIHGQKIGSLSQLDRHQNKRLQSSDKSCFVMMMMMMMTMTKLMMMMMIIIIIIIIIVTVIVTVIVKVIICISLLHCRSTKWKLNEITMIKWYK